MAIKAVGTKVLPNIIAGCWKFRRSSDNFEKDVVELAEIAMDLVNQNLGRGIYHQVHIRSTAKDELGISFVYQIGPNESLVHSDRDWKEIYTDFFRRRTGNGFKGYDIGHSVTEITLVTE